MNGQLEDSLAEPIPKRPSWTLRVGIVLLVFWIATIAARLWWGRVADARLQAVLNDIAARGEVLNPADLPRPNVPDSENAAELYKQACELLGKSLSTEETTNLSGLVDHAELRREHAKEAKAILEKSEQALALCRQARRLGSVDWELDYSVPSFRLKEPRPDRCRSLAKVLCLRGLEAHDGGDDKEAIECVRDALALRKALSEVPSLFAGLCGMTIDGLVCQTLEHIVPTLSVGERAPDVRAERLRSLIEELLDDRAVRRSLFLAFMGERWYPCYYFDRTRADHDHDLAELGVGPELEAVFRQRVVGTFTDPLFRLDEVRALRHADAFVVAAKQLTYSAAVSSLPPEMDVELGWLERLGRPLSAQLAPSFGGAFRMHFSAVAMRRMGAAALAIRLYQLDHGRRPGDLDALVGKYISAVPEDPFAPAGRRISYEIIAKSPILYCVGSDGIDDAGQYTTDIGNILFSRPDVLFFLDGDRPRTKPEWHKPQSTPSMGWGTAPGAWAPPPWPRPMSTTRPSAATSQSRPAAARSLPSSPPRAAAPPRP